MGDNCIPNLGGAAAVKKRCRTSHRTFQRRTQVIGLQFNRSKAASAVWEIVNATKPTAGVSQRNHATRV